MGPGSPVCRGRCGKVWELEAAQSPRTTPISMGKEAQWLRRLDPHVERAGPADRWSVTREGVTVGGAPLRDPWAPQGLPLDTRACHGSGSRDVGSDRSVACTPGRRAAHLRLSNDRVLDIARRSRKGRADWFAS